MMISFISLTVLVLPREGERKPLRVLALSRTFHEKNSKQHQTNRPYVTAINFLSPEKKMKAQTGRISADVAGFQFTVKKS